MRMIRSRRTVGTAIALALVLTACSFNNGYVLDVAIDGGDRGTVVGESLALSASVVRGGGATDRVAWSSSDASVATIDAEGRVASIAPGPTLITATSVSDPSKSGTIALSVDPPGVLRWTRQFGTTGTDYAYGVATDASGHVYVTGFTSGSLEGSIAGSVDAFVRAYDADGDLRWAEQFGTAGEDVARGVASSGNGHVYVAGYTLGALDGSNAGDRDAFVRAYDAYGNLRWTRQFGTSGLDDVAGVATDANGNVFVAGYTLGALDGSSAGSFDAFVRAYAPDGTVRWTRQFGTASDDSAGGVESDGNGNVYVAGSTAGALEGSSAGGRDAFVRAFDTDGNLRWTRQFGTTGSDLASGIAADANGHVYVAGHTDGALEGSSAGGQDAFLRAYDADGNLRWTRQFGTSDQDAAEDVAFAASGGVYVAGATRGSLDGSSAGTLDAFVRAYDADGNLRWTRQFGTSNDDVAEGVATDANGRAYVAGYATGALEESSAGGVDAFVRSYGR